MEEPINGWNQRRRFAVSFGASGLAERDLSAQNRVWVALNPEFQPWVGSGPYIDRSFICLCFRLDTKVSVERSIGLPDATGFVIGHFHSWVCNRDSSSFTGVKAFPAWLDLLFDEIDHEFSFSRAAEFYQDNSLPGTQHEFSIFQRNH